MRRTVEWLAEDVPTPRVIVIGFWVAFTLAVAEWAVRLVGL